MARTSTSVSIDVSKPFRHYSKTVSKRTGRCPILSAFPRAILHDTLDAGLKKYADDAAGFMAWAMEARDFLAPVTTSTISYNHDAFKAAYKHASAGAVPLAKTAWLQGMFIFYWAATNNTRQLSVKDIEALVCGGFEPCPSHLTGSFAITRTHDQYLLECAEQEDDNDDVEDVEDAASEPAVKGKGRAGK